MRKHNKAGEPKDVWVVRRIEYTIEGSRSKLLDWGETGHVPNPTDRFELRGRTYRLKGVVEGHLVH